MSKRHKHIQRQRTFEILSPLKGRIVPWQDVPDDAFRSGLLGRGVAIDPEGSRIVAPFPGLVGKVFPQEHALLLLSEDNIVLFIHIGVNATHLHGQFSALVQENDAIERGDPLIQFDPRLLHANGLCAATPVVVTNAASFQAVQITAQTYVNELDPIMQITL